MTTATLHLHVQRSRFAHHLLSAMAGALPASFRRLLQPAQPLTTAEAAALEAQKVRTLARSYLKTDPGFASDLYAAAARHEGMQG